MMTMDDDQSEAVDWGDGDDGPEETAESIAAGVEADAISLASDDEDDLEALKKYHHNTWDDGREPVASEQASQQDPPPTSAPTTGPVEQQQRDDKSTRDTVPTVHGLPPKPSTAVSYSKAPTSMPVSTSATAMAQHTSGPNGNHNGSETRKVLPPGWEVRNSTSQPSQVYYYHHEAGKTQWEFPTEPLRPTRSANSRERGKRLERPRRSRSREQRARRRSLSPPRGGNTYRPKSRSMERDIPHRSARHVSPKREPPPRVERERQAPKVRSRPSSRERRPSPKPLHRSRSPPPRVRESRDDPRQGGRQESSQQQQHHSSSSTLLIPEICSPFYSSAVDETGAARSLPVVVLFSISFFKAVILMGHLFLSQGISTVRKGTRIDHLNLRNHSWTLIATSKVYTAP
ncbi:hypothetical protein M408DRAFT_84129 [Serendipita vermifera MAFF 305830]|uniref:WW domain-containing protein n=1 Tax=Serendipita vermifera MAFF 305830 TaxID=933852 RepID=A0A0C2X6M0_SERVB|nr:hypothetical protein M408DRAFT_84129 [Serendipita vermifera MAFF 305830]